MRYRALACDYDGTLAHHGKVAPDTLAALKRLTREGFKLILVSGRELADLLAVFAEVTQFDWTVLENGAVLYRPATRDLITLEDPPSTHFVEQLRERGVDPLAVGQVIIATRQPHEIAVRSVIDELSLPLQVILNKGAVMILPAGTSKATGLTAALVELGIKPGEVVGIGDAENDCDFLAICGLSVAVGNALPCVKNCVNVVTQGNHGAGVVETIDKLVEAKAGDS